MPIDARIGIVGGNGWLGSAIARAAVSSGAIDTERLILSGRSIGETDARIPGARTTRDNAELAAESDVILLSVRPEHFPGVCIDATDKLVISVMAGMTAQTIKERTSAAEVVRAIPNAAAIIGHSFTPWFATSAVTSTGKLIVQMLFDACGEAAEVPQESYIDYCVALTGTGTAFPALLAEALAAHAVSRRLPKDFAARAAKGVVARASQLFADQAGDAAEIVQDMIDYRGVTAVGLQSMIDNGFNMAVAAGLDAALAKGKVMTLSN